MMMIVYFIYQVSLSTLIIIICLHTVKWFQGLTFSIITSFFFFQAFLIICMKKVILFTRNYIAQIILLDIICLHTVT